MDDIDLVGDTGEPDFLDDAIADFGPDVTDVNEAPDFDATIGEVFPSGDLGFNDIESVSQTDVSNFNESGLTTTSDVADYIETNIPEGHLDDLDSIEYVDDDVAVAQGELGMWTFDPSSEAAHIEVYPHSDEGELYDTVAHEIGHNAELTLDSEQLDKWNQLYQESGSDEFVTPYAKTDPQEDFAESYAFYINDPPLMQATSTEKYDFLKDNVFEGKEF
jgi:hypothetical protein